MYTSIADSSGHTYHQLVTLSHRDFWDSNPTGHGVHKEVEGVLPRRRISQHSEGIDREREEDVPPVPWPRSPGQLQRPSDGLDRTIPLPRQQPASRGVNSHATNALENPPESGLEGIPYRDTHGFTFDKPLPTLNPTPSVPHRRSSERSRSRVRFSNIPESDPAPAIPQQDVSAIDRGVPSISSKIYSQPDLPRQVPSVPPSTAFDSSLSLRTSNSGQRRPRSLGGDIPVVSNQHLSYSQETTNNPGLSFTSIRPAQTSSVQSTVPFYHSPADVGRVNSQTCSNNDRLSHQTQDQQYSSNPPNSNNPIGRSTEPTQDYPAQTQANSHADNQPGSSFAFASQASSNQPFNSEQNSPNTGRRQLGSQHHSNSASQHLPLQYEQREQPNRQSTQPTDSPVRPEPTVLPRGGQPSAPDEVQSNPQRHFTTGTQLNSWASIPRKPIATGLYTTTTHTGPTVIPLPNSNSTSTSTDPRKVSDRKKTYPPLPASHVVTTTTTTTTTVPPNGVTRTTPNQKPSLIDRMKGNGSDGNKATKQIAPAQVQERKRDSLLSRRNHGPATSAITVTSAPQRSQSSANWMNKLRGVGKKDNSGSTTTANASTVNGGVAGRGSKRFY